MALRRFSDNPAATLPLDGTETIPALQAGVDVQVKVSDIVDAASGAVTSVNGATGAVVLALDDLDDVDAATPSDGDVLAWNDAAGAWEPAAGGGGAVSSVNGQTGVVQIDAEDVPYSNTTSGLAATDVQGAIDELAATPPGPAAWGAITGTLADQTDLQAALDAKASAVVDVSTPSNSSGTVTLNFAGKSKYVGAITLSANVTTLAFSNLPGPGKYAEYELHITQDGTGSRTFAIPSSHKALGGSDTSIASAPNAVTVLTASTVDNGTTWRYAMQESA